MCLMTMRILIVEDEEHLADLLAEVLGHDDRRTIATIDPDYYRWTQWIFLQIYNSWYDADAVREDGGLGRARPISELVVQFESGDRPTPNGRAWEALSPSEQSAILDSHRLAYTSNTTTARRRVVCYSKGLTSVIEFDT